jgi:hypothetical protein
MDNFTQTPQGKSVEIKSMTVSIQVITVNNKQMTQAVFKQLPEKEYFDEEGYIIGNLWGRVKHEFGHYKDGFWIVFELNGLLYKTWNHKIDDYIKDIVDKKNELESSIVYYIKDLLKDVYPEEISCSTNQIVRIGTERKSFIKDKSHLICEVTGIDIEDISIDFSIDFSGISSAFLIAEIQSIRWNKSILKFSGSTGQDEFMEYGLYGGCIYLIDGKLFAGAHPSQKRYPSQLRDKNIEYLKNNITNLSIYLQNEKRFFELKEQISELPQLFIAV